MELIAKAKPIHFRIISSGVECTSLDDLFRHFDKDSIADTIKDGRLSRWLRQIQEKDVADKIDKIRGLSFTTRDNILKLYSALVDDELNPTRFPNDVDLVKYFEGKSYTKKLAESLMKQQMKKDFAMLSHVYDYHKELIDDLEEAFEIFAKKNDIEAMWILGRNLYFEANDSKKKKGIDYINRAANKGHKKAIDFKKKNKIKDKKIYDNDLSLRIKEIAMEFQTWRYSYSKTAKRKFIEEKKLYGINDIEKSILDFCIFCCELAAMPNLKSIFSYIERNIPANDKLSKSYIFLSIYLAEIKGHPEAIKRYRALGYKPATERAKDLGKYNIREVITRGTSTIKMPLNPSYEEFLKFLHNFMLNICYLYE